MTLENTAAAPAADTTASPAEPQAYDENTALARIEGLLGMEDAAERQQDSGEMPEDGAGETPPTGEEEGHSEPPATAAIEPPKSWSDEEKAVFGKLPPEAQQVIAGRESERDKAFTQKTQEIADQRKAVEAHTQAIQQERAKYVQNLHQLAVLAIPPEAQRLLQLTPADWAQLSTENPAEYVRLDGARKAIEGRLGAIQQEIARTAQTQAAQQQQQIADTLGKEAKILAERIPEFADETKKAKLVTELRADLSGRGFSEHEIASVTDHRLVEVGVDAMKWRQHQAALKAAKAKEATTTPPPRVQQPGSAQGRDNRGTQQIRDLQGKFLKNGGDIETGAALIEALNLV